MKVPIEQVMMSVVLLGHVQQVALPQDLLLDQGVLLALDLHLDLDPGQGPDQDQDHDLVVDPLHHQMDLM